MGPRLRGIRIPAGDSGWARMTGWGGGWGGRVGDPGTPARGIRVPAFAGMRGIRDGPPPARGIRDGGVIGGGRWGGGGWVGVIGGRFGLGGGGGGGCLCR